MAQRRGIPRPSNLPGPGSRRLNAEEVPSRCQNKGPPPQQTGIRPPMQLPRSGMSGLRPPSQQTRPLESSGLRPPSQQTRPPGSSGLRPPSQQTRPPGSSGLQPPSQIARPGVSGLRPPSGMIRPATSRLQPPNHSFMRPPPAEQRSQSVPPPHASRINVTTTSRSGGQIPTIPALGLNSTMVGTDQTFVPGAASSRVTVTQPRSIGYRSNVPPRQPQLSDISMIQQPGVAIPQDSSIIARAPPSRVEKKVRSALLNESSLQPGIKVAAKAKTVYEGPKKLIVTPAGKEPILQQTVLEKRVERDEEGETIIKNVTISNLNESTGMMENVEMGIQEFDPKYGTTDIKELIGTSSTVSVTPEFTTVTKDYQRATTTPISPDIGISPQEVSRLVEEEKEDVINTLSMMPPDLILEPGKYEIKHRLQQMRLNAESVALLEQSIIKPEVTADEAQEELSPEAVATVMYTVEIGIKPESSPDQVFNTLFQESPNEHFIKISSVTPGPLQDVVVPTEVPKDIHKEIISQEMTKLTDKIGYRDPEKIPATDIFNKVMEEAQKNPKQGKINPRKFPMIQDERSLWINANLEPLVNIVGAEPADILDPYNLDELEKSGNLESELMKGVEYFVETNPIQYVNRVQLRGSQSPSYFPGFMVATPDLPDLVKIVKSPDEVFALAWKSVQPKYFEEDTMMSLLG